MPNFIPYAILIIVLAVLAIVYQYVDARQKRNITIGCYVMFLFFFGFRGYIWHDWQAYSTLFLDCDQTYLRLNPFEGGTEHFFEPGYMLFNLLVKQFTNSYPVFQFIQTTICLTLLFRFAHLKRLNIPFFLMLFLTFEGYVILINLMRNAISILIFLNALPYIEERRPIPYFLLCIVATTFHLTSILFIPLYYILNIKTNRWVFLSVILAALVVFVFKIKLLTPILSILFGGSDTRFEIMAEQYSKFDEAKTISIGLIERLLTTMLTFAYYKELLQAAPKNHIYINMLLLYLSCVLFLSEFTVVSTRLGLLVICGYWIVWYYMPKVFLHGNNRILFCLFILVYSIVKSTIYNYSDIYKYQNHLFGADSYEECCQKVRNYED